MPWWFYASTSPDQCAFCSTATPFAGKKASPETSTSTLAGERYFPTFRAFDWFDLKLSCKCLPGRSQYSGQYVFGVILAELPRYSQHAFSMHALCSVTSLGLEPEKYQESVRRLPFFGIGSHCPKLRVLETFKASASSPRSYDDGIVLWLHADCSHL